MSKYRKKPIVVEATQWFPGTDVPGVILHQPPDEVIGGRGHGEQRFPQDPRPAVITIHGQAAYLEPGDWVITESDGVHHYPCKPAVFDATYDPADLP